MAHSLKLTFFRDIGVDDKKYVRAYVNGELVGTIPEEHWDSHARQAISRAYVLGYEAFTKHNSMYVESIGEWEEKN